MNHPTGTQKVTTKVTNTARTLNKKPSMAWCDRRPVSAASGTLTGTLFIIIIIIIIILSLLSLLLLLLLFLLLLLLLLLHVLSSLLLLLLNI